MKMRRPNYLKEALRAVTGKRYPGKLPDYEATEASMGHAELTKLQDWCSVNARPRWATGLSMIEAAELIVSQAVDNCNIPRQESGYTGRCAHAIAVVVVRRERAAMVSLMAATAAELAEPVELVEQGDCCG